MALSEGMQLLCLLSECIALARPATAKGLSVQLVGLGARYTQNPRYGMLGYVRTCSLCCSIVLVTCQSF